MKISIITVNLNNSDGLDKTIDSVQTQITKNYEHIIIDGGSSDDSLEIIKKHKNHITIYISEPDTGVYDAMNKGIKLAKGEYIYFLNSGDYFIKNNALEIFEKTNSNEDFVYFNIKTDLREIIYPTSLSMLFFYQWTICHQAVFIKSSIFDKNGHFDLDYKITADWVHLAYNICFCSATYKHINEIITFYEENGLSSNPKNQEQITDERKKYLTSVLPEKVFIDYQNYINTLNELQFYKSSKLVQFVAAIQKSKIYKNLRNVQ